MAYWLNQRVKHTLGTTNPKEEQHFQYCYYDTVAGNNGNILFAMSQTNGLGHTLKNSEQNPSLREKVLETLE